GKKADPRSTSPNERRTERHLARAVRRAISAHLAHRFGDGARKASNGSGHDSRPVEAWSRSWCAAVSTAWLIESAVSAALTQPTTAANQTRWMVRARSWCARAGPSGPGAGAGSATSGDVWGGWAAA